ncbi:MAG: biotin transporter BioY [Candidatus Omnitrophica bacterium]|nr:biotin transporter BioY [Candidatus Omnitrophota bacterium]
MEAVLKKEIIVNKILCRLAGVLLFVVLTALGAFVRIPLPFTPVPLTLQTFFVLLSGAFLGARLGVVAQLSYVMLGVWGLPIFTGAGSGLLYLFGPTGGYLLGFVLAAMFLGRTIRQARDNLFLIFVFFCIADAILLFCGSLWLGMLFKVSFVKSLLVGFLPFIPGDLLKALFAAFLYLGLRPRLEEIF